MYNILDLKSGKWPRLLCVLNPSSVSSVTHRQTPSFAIENSGYWELKNVIFILLLKGAHSFTCHSVCAICCWDWWLEHVHHRQTRKHLHISLYLMKVSHTLSMYLRICQWQAYSDFRFMINWWSCCRSLKLSFHFWRYTHAKFNCNIHSLRLPWNLFNPLSQALANDEWDAKRSEEVNLPWHGCLPQLLYLTELSHEGNFLSTCRGVRFKWRYD